MKTLKNNSGSVLVMAIIAATIGTILFVAILGLAYQNYKVVKANNTRSNAYYVADFGMERVLKNLETIVSSAKIYANEQLTKKDATTGISDYDNILAGKTAYDYKTRFEQYFQYYLTHNAAVTTPTPATGDVAAILTTTSSTFSPQLPGLPNAKYSSTVTKSATFNTDYTLTVTVTGDSNSGQYKRVTVATIGISPWGYSNSNTAANTQVVSDKNNLYSSQQWTSAIASSGDVWVKGGPVTINGDLYVNGHGYNGIPDDAATGMPVDGSQYGGLVVGDPNGIVGTLTVNGNIFSNNYVHTKYPNSKINVNARPGVTTYSTNVDNIYSNTDPVNKYFAENQANLNDGGNYNPLGHISGSDYDSSMNGNEELQKTSKTFSDYLKYTYGIQKLNGGFIYAGDVQIDKNLDGVTDTTPQQINIAGSAAVYDNLEVDDIGTITLNKNFYGFRNSISDFNDSSSIVTNHPDGDITIMGRVYDADTAYVTAFNDIDADGKREAGEEFYQTGEAASLYKNFYAYRTNLDSVPIPGKTGTYTEPFATANYNPFSFLDFKSTQYYVDTNGNLNTNGGTLVDGLTLKLTHVLAYHYKYQDNATPLEPLISEGGQRYDKGMITYNGSIYDNTKLATVDMGYSSGILMGTNTLGKTFVAYLNPYNSTDPIGFINNYKAQKSLDYFSFKPYIQNKYSTLFQLKALKYKDMSSNKAYTVSIQDLIPQTDFDKLSGSGGKASNVDSSVLNTSYNVSKGDIYIQAAGTQMKIYYNSAPSGTPVRTISKNASNQFEFDGLILSGGKVTIDNQTTSPIVIKGAVVSAVNPDSTGVEFVGSGSKEIDYDEDTMLNIISLPTDDAKVIKGMLTSRRGSVEMFKKVYAQQAYIHNHNAGASVPFYNAVRSFASSYVDYEATPVATKPIPLTGDGSDEDTMQVNGENISIPEAAIEALANRYEIYDKNQVTTDYYNDKVVLYQSVIDQLMAQGSKNYRIITWGSTQ